MRRSKSIKAAAAIFAMGVVTLSLSIASLPVVRLSAIENAAEADKSSASTLDRRRLRDRRTRNRAAAVAAVAVESDAPQPPPARGRSNNIEEGEENDFDPNSYAYLIVHYHKTGHHLSRSLRDFLVAGTDGGTGPVSNDRENVFLHRMHEEATGCPRAMELNPGVIHVQAAPNFFCDTNVLAEYLLRNDNTFREKKGVKIVHLVRNPFSLAVSNFAYHAQFPTPELWVKHVDPCVEELWFEHQSLEDLVRPTLLAGNDPVMKNGDFEGLHKICTELYRTRKAAIEREWSFYTHLRHLDSESALSLATTHMMIQGKSGGDILRMASNIVKLKQLQRLEDQIRLSQHTPPKQERMIQVMTLSMAEFTREPRASTLRFLDFALGNASPPETKERIAAEYERSYLEKVREGDEHITADKEIKNGQDENIVEKKGALEGYLREHELFGRVLGNIERLVNDALRDSGGNGVGS